MYKTKKTKDEVNFHYYLYGINYGYPECCTQEFVENLDNKESDKRNVCFIAAGNTGFVPCYKHSCQILNNEIKINDLIKNRICDYKFKTIKRRGRIKHFTGDWETKFAVQTLMMLKND